MGQIICVKVSRVHVCVCTRGLFANHLSHLSCLSRLRVSNLRTFLSNFPTFLSDFPTFLGNLRTFLSKFRTFLSDFRTLRIYCRLQRYTK